MLKQYTRDLSSYKMKGREALLEFLQSGRDLSEASKALPSTICDREALLSMCYELHKKVPKDAAPTSDLSAEAQEFKPEKSPNPSTKPENEKLCPSMWGKRDCPGEDCVRVHLKWCAKPSCYINEERNKDCPLWHGHKWVAAAKAKKSLKEAKKKKEVREHQQTQGNSAKGKWGAPQWRQPQSQNWTQRQGPQTTGKQSQHRFASTPAPTVSVWDTAQAVSIPGPRTTPVVPMPRTTSHENDPRLQMQRLLQMQLALLQSGAF